MIRRAVPTVLLWALAASVAYAQADVQLREQLRQADALERAGATAQAVEVLQSILEVRPAQTAAILGLERIYRRADRLGNLMPVLRRAIDHEPGSALVRQIELRVLGDLGRPEELRASGERWIAARPNSETPYREYAGALRQIGEDAAAEAVLLRGREALGRDDALGPQLADLYLDTGRFAAAATEWSRIARSRPGMGWELVTFKLETAGPAADPAAMALLEQLDPEGTEVERKLRAVAAVYVGRPEEARTQAGPLFDQLDASHRRDLADRIAEVAARRSYPGLVAWSYRRVLGDVVDDSTRWDLAKRILQHDLNAGDTSAALALLDDMLERSDSKSATSEWASGERVRLLAVTDPTSAEEAFAAHARRYPDDRALPSLAMSVAEANIQVGRYDDAERALDRARPTDASIQSLARFSELRGYLALYRGQHEAARSELEFAARGLRGEARGEAIRVLGFLRDGNTSELLAVAAAHRLERQGEPLRAFEELLDRLERAPASRARPAILLWAGELALAAGAVERGEVVLRSIADRYPDSGEAPVALLTLAEALNERGRSDEAITLLEQVIVDYPDSALTPIARRRLAEVEQEVPRS